MNRYFCNLLEGYKKKIYEQDDIVRESKKLKYTSSKLYENKFEKAIKDTMIKCNEIIFGTDGPICIKCLDELWK